MLCIIGMCCAGRPFVVNSFLGKGRARRRLMINDIMSIYYQTVASSLKPMKNRLKKNVSHINVRFIRISVFPNNSEPNVTVQELVIAADVTAGD